MKYPDKILQPQLCLSAHIIEVKLEILETNKKSEEILHFYLIFGVFLDFYCGAVKRNIHVLVTILYNLNLACQHI